MDNLWIYLLLIFVYVGYSIMKGARKQREAAAKQAKAKRTLSINIPQDEKGVEKDPLQNLLSRGELLEETNPLITIRKSPLPDTERKSPSKPVSKKSGKFSAVPKSTSSLEERDEENPYAMEVPSFRSKEELRRGIILSEILHRKYS